MREDFGGGENIGFERLGRAGVVTLTRPAALNALNHDMVKALGRALRAWADDDEVGLVLVRGEGRAFCAGGDIMDVYKAGLAGRATAGFFADEYRLNAAIHAYPKPYVALIDGIVMGGGAGLSIHGSHRVFTQNAVFAMPEVGIGFFPDIGASHFLPRLKGEFGTYLALTGDRIGCGDACWCGLATHVVPAEGLGELVDRLAASGDVDATLKKACIQPERETDDACLFEIARHFTGETLDDIVASLRQGRQAGDAFADATLATIEKRSPTSLHVACRQLRAGEMLPLEECLRMEFRILNRMLQSHDFYEGIRAALVDKDGAPQWRPASLEDVDPAAIEAYFAPLDAELDL